MLIWIDIETYSTVDLKSTGGFAYAQNCELMMIAYALGDGPAKVWDCTNQKTMPTELSKALRNPENKLVAHNTQFERWVLSQTLSSFDWNLNRWVDTMVLAATNGLPNALAQVCEAMRLAEEHTKMWKTGKRLVNVFCKPAPKNHKADRYTSANKPEDWTEFLEYCRRDVISMREIARGLPDRNYQIEYQNWLMQLRMNDRGLPVDVELASKFITLLENAEAKITIELLALTKGEVQTHNQTVRIIKWCASQGYVLPDLTAGTVEKVVAEGAAPQPVLDIMRIRQTLGKSSTAKYQKIMIASVDGRLHGAFQFYGAGRTGREAGRLYQPQNLPRPEKGFDVDYAIKHVLDGHPVITEEVHRAASSCLRSLIKAPEGEHLIVADLANIEGRVVAWLAGEEWKLQAFRDYDDGTGPDIYKLSYSRAFKVDIDQVDDTNRQVGKVQELALAYQGSIGAFNQMAASYGVELSDNRVYDIVNKWRAAHPRIVKLWYEAETAWKAAMAKPGTAYKIGDRVSIAYFGTDNTINIRLPSGRDLVYREPEIKAGRIDFMGLDGYTKQWARIDTYGGKLIENITQAAARDLMYHGMVEAEDYGFDIIGTVHDEIIALNPIEDPLTDKDLSDCMARLPSWAPGLPLAAEGYTATRYRK